MSKIICIYHSRDLDGWMSAAIVKHYYSLRDESFYEYDLRFMRELNNPKNSIDFLGWDYGDNIPDLSEYDKVIMCDISFPYEEMKAIGRKLIWIDHHSSAINEMNRRMKDDNHHILGTTSTDYAACELTWIYFFGLPTMPEIVRLLGRYDCFGHKGTDEEQEVLEFQYGARQVITDYKSAYEHLVESLRSNSMVFAIQSAGKVIYQYLQTEAKQTYAKSFSIELHEMGEERELEPGVITIDGYVRDFLVVNQERFNPINFGIDYHKDGYDGFGCFWFANGLWNWSLYNDNGEVDCSAIAKTYGGGGHKGAAGFVTTDLHKVFPEFEKVKTETEYQ